MRRDLELEATVVEKYATVEAVLDERGRRVWSATESRAIGYGGDALVSDATGMSRTTIRAGRREIASGTDSLDRIRRPGAGRPSIEQTQPGIKQALEKRVDPLSRGDPQSPLRWTCKSRAKLSAVLSKAGWKVSSTTVGRLLHELGYSLQSMRKSREGTSHPEHNAQFEHINTKADEFLQRAQPVVSVDTKKKERVGDVKNGDREWQPKGQPEQSLVHDFPQDSAGKAIPYGIYDMGRNEAWVNVGRDHDTPAFAVASLRRWWNEMGKRRYADAHELFITADAGGSNGYRSRAWKYGLQKFADETRLRIHVSHLPPGTSKWNKIEHRLFCHITQNWRGKPLRTFETIVDLIGNTRTDETRWMIHVRGERGDNPRCWLWRCLSEDTVRMHIYPTRSAQAARVLFAELGEKLPAILVCDRYGAYRKRVRELPERFVLATCWVHARRDFIRVAQGHPKLRAWGERWLERFAGLYALNARRLAHFERDAAMSAQPAAFNTAQRRLERKVAERFESAERELGRVPEGSPKAPALRALVREREGLSVFVDEPSTPMDNNASNADNWIMPRWVPNRLIPLTSTVNLSA